MFQGAAMAMAVARALGASSPKEPETHDLSRSVWGRASTVLKVVDGGQRLRACGFGRGISEGDFLILPNGAETTRYRVDRIEYMREPTDQWFADLVFSPRARQEA